MLGKQVEGYRITSLIGKGGMGVVYEAVHDGIGQRAAVKVLFPEFSTDVDAVSRFVAEAKAASKVRHGGLVKIFYSGRLEDGTAYIMMEFLDGESIEERCRRLAREGKRLELAAVIRIGQQVASALSAVHREGIVHRDLKPANIILVEDPEISGGERIKVVDFGIAKFDRSTTEISKTTVGRFLGTALYASPEQCQMAGEVGPQADVY
jgi:serine/threonine-protein kinase